MDIKSIKSVTICTNPHYEEDIEQALMIDGDIIFKGDQYHDKIVARIEGYIQALRDWGYEGKVETKEITRDHPFYAPLGFYDEEGY